MSNPLQSEENIISKNKGPIFWAEKIIKEFTHLTLLITEGSQKWAGATPIFNIIENISKYIGLKGKIIYENILLKEINNKILPIAWTKKYFTLADDEELFPLIEITGINEIKFNSKPSQTNNQFVENNIIKIEKNIIRIKKGKKGINNISI